MSWDRRSGQSPLWQRRLWVLALWPGIAVLAWICLALNPYRSGQWLRKVGEAVMELFPEGDPINQLLRRMDQSAAATRAATVSDDTGNAAA